jgi:hypothetical protein
MVQLIHFLFSKMSFLILPILTSYIIYFQISRNMDGMCILTEDLQFVHKESRVTGNLCTVLD